MTDKELIKRIRELLEEDDTSIKPLQMVGKLTAAQGIKGFKVCEPGYPVFIKGDRYVLFMETLDGKTVVEVPYHPQTLMVAMEVCDVYTPTVDTNT